MLAALLLLLVLLPRNLVRAPDRLLALSIAAGAAIANSNSLFRSDQDHLLNTTIMLPLALISGTVVIVGAVVRGRKWKPQILHGLVSLVVLVSLLVWLVPSQARSPSYVFGRLSAPLEFRATSFPKLEAPSRTLYPTAGSQIAASRLGPTSADPDALCCWASETTRKEMIDFAGRLHSLSVDRVVYLAPSIPSAQASLLPFIADLIPYHTEREYYSMVFNQQGRSEYVETLLDDRRPLDVVVGAANDGSPEFAAALQKLGPDVEVIELEYADTPVVVVRRRQPT